MKLVLSKFDKREVDLMVPSSYPLRGEVEVQLREDVSITNPTFIMTHGWDYSKAFNYAYVEAWGRYYFIDDIVIDRNLVYIKCSEDLLASWYDEIMDSTLWCSRSYSNPDYSITDTYYPTLQGMTTSVRNVSTPWSSYDTGSYIIGVSGGGEQYHVGGNSYYVLNSNEMASFIDALMNNEFSITGIVDSVSKAMVDPLDYILSCKWYPFTVIGGQTVTNVHFSWWYSHADATVLTQDDLVYSFDREIDISDLWGEDCVEYEKYSPYSQLALLAPPFGIIQLSPAAQSQAVKTGKVKLKVQVDLVTGMGTLFIGDPCVTMTTSLVGIDIPVGEVIQDYIGSITSLAGGFTGGGGLGAANGVISAIQAFSPEPSVSGTCGGFAQLQLDDPWTVELNYLQPCDVNNELYGAPCCKAVKVSKLSGFCQFENPHISGTMFADERSGIETLLSGGVYIA